MKFIVCTHEQFIFAALILEGYAREMRNIIHDQTRKESKMFVHEDSGFVLTCFMKPIHIKLSLVKFCFLLFFDSFQHKYHQTRRYPHFELTLLLQHIVTFLMKELCGEESQKNWHKGLTKWWIVQQFEVEGLRETKEYHRSNH